MIVAGTGHRTNKLGIKENSQAIHDRLYSLATAFLVRTIDRYPDSSVQIIAGGALGWDTALACASLDLGLHLTLAIPFEQR